MTHTELLDELVVLLDNYLNEDLERFGTEVAKKAMFLQGMREGFDTLSELLKDGEDGEKLLKKYEASILRFLLSSIPEQADETDEARDY